MDATPARDPLTIPVAETTPEEHEIQARYHGTNAAYGTLRAFLQDVDGSTPVFAHFGEPVLISHTDKHGASTLGTVQIIWLAELDGGERVVFFRPTNHVIEHDAPVTGSYGIIDASLRTLHEYSLDEIDLLTNVEVIRTMSRKLNELKLCGGLYAAGLRVLDEKRDA